MAYTAADVKNLRERTGAGMMDCKKALDEAGGDIEVAVDMLELADRIDHAVLFSGDSDFRRLVEAVQRKGVRVSVVSSIRTSPPMDADELRRQADQFLELSEIASEFTRRQTEPRTRPVPVRQTPAEPYDPNDAA